MPPEGEHTICDHSRHRDSQDERDEADATLGSSGISHRLELDGQGVTQWEEQAGKEEDVNQIENDRAFPQ